MPFLSLEGADDLRPAVLDGMLRVFGVFFLSSSLLSFYFFYLRTGKKSIATSFVFCRSTKKEGYPSYKRTHITHIHYTDTVCTAVQPCLSHFLYIVQDLYCRHFVISSHTKERNKERERETDRGIHFLVRPSRTPYFKKGVATHTQSQ